MNILNKLTLKHLAMNKRRTIVTIVGIILSTSLMVGIGLLLSTMRELMIDDIINSKGNYHVAYVDIDKSNLSKIKNNVNIDNTLIRQKYGYSKISKNIDDYYKIYGAEDKYLNTLKIVKGRLPKNNSEIVIPNHVIDDYKLNIKIGDTITFDIGERKDSIEIDDEAYSPTEYLEINRTNTYKVVGIIKKDVYEGGSIGYNLYTTMNLSNNVGLDIITRYKNPKDTYDITDNIVKTIKINKNELGKHIVYNDSLLSMYGASKYDNFITAVIGMLAILLGLVSIACIIVIYNSFAISVMERKKQFGLFSSIGATKSQIKKTVLFEAIIVSLIGIPLGIIAAYIGIGVVIIILNKLIGSTLIGGITFKLVTYPLFLIIPIIFMIVTVLVSAFLPAMRASKISPIEAIRLNDDIKIKGKKVKTSKIINKIFGIEGSIALKSMKRNKKKYRITIVSLVISTVLFISFSAYMKYTIDSAYKYVKLPKFDIQVDYNTNTNENILNKIENNKDVKDSVRYKMLGYTIKTDYKKLYLNSFYKFMKKYDYYDNLDNEVSYFYVLDDKYYKEYLEKIGITEELPIIYNKYSDVIFEKQTSGKSTRKSYNLNKYSNNMPKLDIYRDGNKISSFDKYYISNEPILSIEVFEGIKGEHIILSESMYNRMPGHEENVDEKYMILKAPVYNNVKKVINDYIKSGSLSKDAYVNVNEQMQMVSNLMLAIKILVYGFIALVTLIGVTSVFNTINTSIQLRRKEFAVLRSIGLTPKGFNKMLCLESLFFGIKSIIYSIPLSLGVIYLMSKSMNELVERENIIIPWGSIIVAIIGVFIIIGISMIYSTHKIKRENILDAIREENI